MALLPLRDRPPNEEEFEALKLALSTFLDGTGMVVHRGESQPGWRDFERAIAAVFGGDCPEDKGVFDVTLHAKSRSRLDYGLSLKTSKEGVRKGQVLMELSNSHAKFWARLDELGIDPASQPAEAGPAIIDLIAEWHNELADQVDVEASSYLVLTHDKTWTTYRLYWYDLNIHDPDPRNMEWSHEGKRIFGRFGDVIWWDWYGWSGGQLKYYPPEGVARWASEPFELVEPPYLETPLDRAKRYWPAAFEENSLPERER